MTKAQIRTAIRNLVNEQSTDAGALMPTGDSIIDNYIEDAVEEVVLDLLPYMPRQFCGTENISLTADEPDYTLSALWWQIYKIARNTTGKTPREIQIIDPLEEQFYTSVGDTEDSPDQCYILGDTITFVKTPSADKTDYAKVFFVRPEAVTIPDTGPAYIPRAAHRMIVYKACALACMMVEALAGHFIALYEKRKASFLRVWAAREHQKPRFVRDSIFDRIGYSDREAAFYDLEWP